MVQQEQIIEQLKIYHQAFSNPPKTDDIIDHIHMTETKCNVRKQVAIAVKRAKLKMKTKNKMLQKKILKRVSNEARQKAINYSDRDKEYDEHKLHFEDGWKNRMMIETDKYIFVYMGYAITVDCKESCFRICEMKKTSFLNQQLSILNVIFHLYENGCEFDYCCLHEKYKCCSAIFHVRYSNYVPRPPKLRRSYNSDLYKHVSDIVVRNDWENRVECPFNKSCYMFKVDGVKYIVDMHDGKIEKLVEF